ncbi:MAG TPA: type II toxin-antitoxin system RelE/ParE family toxin [Thermoanaerobaculia bacterium]|nr:type II toxin-antitoxin system RelE/ParE family toxin [Thermoanaerobaculia bacterium]
MREVHFYRTKAGHCPVEEFLDELSGKQVQKVVWVLRLIEELETIPSQYLKKLPGTEGLWEARAQHGGDTFRLIGFFEGRRLLVLTSGFAKKTERIPRQEIALAEKRRQDHQSRRQQR